MDLVDLLLEIKKKNEKYFKNPKKYAKIIKKKAKEILGEVEVYLFGSIVRGDFGPDSDIDVLVVSENLNKEKIGEIKAQILRQIDFFAPFQIHLITKEEYENWYKNFIKEKIKI